jgi:carbonic anhydrase
MVVGTDFNLMAGVQYAVSDLKIPDIIVCGHYDCAGIQASFKRNDGPIESWLTNVRDM